VSRVEAVDAAEAPADEADLAPVLVVQVAQLLLERMAELELEAGVLAEAPRHDIVAAGAQEDAETHQGGVRGAEPGHEQHRMAVAAWGRLQQRQEERQGPDLEQRPAFEQ
jgi:hypothetical protein